MYQNKPYAMKPLITTQTASEKGLTIEDLNFIYLRPEEYELDTELLLQVENFRREHNLEINEEYMKKVRTHALLDKNTKWN
jgi:hypothetical protein